jgi:hypothetical protein
MAIVAVMAHTLGAASRSAACWIVVGAGFTGLASCARAPEACAGQCAPPYELQVGFQPGTRAAQAESVLKACADGNPVVIRIGALQVHGEQSQALIYTHAFGNSKRTDGLIDCLRASDLTEGVGWPD